MTKVLPVGAQTYSKAPDRYPPGSPTNGDMAKGPWVWCDGRRYLDTVNGLGAVILGHQHPVVDYAIQLQMDRGISFPLPTRMEEAVARTLLDMLTWKGAESVRYGKNGADVTGSAIRLARRVTGRERVLYCHYHGHHDWSMRDPPWNGGVPMDTPSHPVNLHPTGIPQERPPWPPVQDEPAACIVLEAVSSAKPTGPVVEDFAQLRQWCTDTGTLLVLDEMVTGFRCALGGAAQLYGIQPDLACYGKAMANGMPLSAIVGPWDILRHYERDVFFSTTHGGEALSLAAAHATLRFLVDNDVPAELAKCGRKVMEVAKGSYGAYPQRVMLDYTQDQLATMVRAGVLTQGYVNVTWDMARSVNAMDLLLGACHKANTVVAP